MSKQKLSQDEIDKIVVAGRVVSKPTSLGGGVVDVDFFVSIDSKNIWQHKIWHSMLSRCFCEKLKQRSPTYIGVTVCAEWLYFGNFFEWVNKEVGYKGKPVGLHLDKDLMVKGNKVYSPDTCSFVPDAINLLLSSCAARRGDCPLGVSHNKKFGGYRAGLNCWGKQIHLGTFNTPEEAFAAYKVAKEDYIKVVIMHYKDTLTPLVYDSLMNWEIEK